LSAAFRLQNAPRRIALERGRGPSLAVEEAEPTTLHQRKRVRSEENPNQHRISARVYN